MKREHGLTSKECYVCASPKYAEQTEKQEPVAWLYQDAWGTLKLSQIMPPPVGAFPVYTTPTAAQTEREKVAAWMMARGYATGHGDTIEDLLREAEWQIREHEREARWYARNDKKSFKSTTPKGLQRCALKPYEQGVSNEW